MVTRHKLARVHQYYYCLDVCVNYNGFGLFVPLFCASYRFFFSCRILLSSRGLGDVRFLAVVSVAPRFGVVARYKLTPLGALGDLMFFAVIGVASRASGLCKIQVALPPPASFLSMRIKV